MPDKRSGLKSDEFVRGSSQDLELSPLLIGPVLEILDVIAEVVNEYKALQIIAQVIGKFKLAQGSDKL